MIPLIRGHLVEIVKTENIMVDAEGGENGEFSFGGYRVAVLQNEKCSGDGWWDGSTTLWIFLIPLNCTPKIVKKVNFMLYVFYCNKKKLEKIFNTEFYIISLLNLFSKH